MNIRILKYLLLLPWWVFSAYGQSGAVPISFQRQLEICELMYDEGSYKGALEMTGKMIKKLEQDADTASGALAQVLMARAKYLEALARYDLFEEAMQRSLALRKAKGETHLAYGLGQIEAASLYLLYGDLVQAEAYLNGAKNILTSRSSAGFGSTQEQQDTYFDAQMLFVETSIAYWRGNFEQVEALLPKLKEIRYQRITSRELFYDEMQDSFQWHRLGKPQVRRRKREYADVLTLEAMAIRDRGSYAMADTLFREADDWIRQKIHPTGIDIAAVNNTHEWLVLRTILGEDLSDLRRDMEKNLFRAERSVGLVHRSYIKAHGLLIKGYTSQHYNVRGRKQLWELRTNTKRYYSEKKMPYAIYERLEAQRSFYGQSNSLLGGLRFGDRESILERAGERLRDIQANIEKVPMNHVERIEVLDQLYRVALALNQLDSAQSYLQQLLERKEAIYGKESLGYHLTRLELAEFLMHNSNDLEQVRPILDESFHGYLEQNLLPTSFDYIHALREYAVYYQAQDQYDSARVLAEQAVVLTAQNVSEQHPLYANAMTSLLGLQLDQGAFQQAYSTIDSVMRIYDEHYGRHFPYSFEYANALRTAARYYATVGLFDEARMALNRSQRYAKRSDASQVDPEARNNQMALLIQTEKLKQAERLVLEELEQKRAVFGAESRLLINPYLYMASIYLIDGDFIDAQEMVEQAHAIAQKAYGDQSFRTMQVLLLRAQVLTSIGSYAAAQADLKQVLEVNARIFGEGHMQMAEPYMQLGLVTFFSDAGKVAEAEGLIQKSLDILSGSLGSDNPSYAEGLKTLARVHTAVGKLEEAEAGLQAANNIWTAKLGTELNSNSAEIAMLLGDVEVKKRAYAVAQGHYERARRIYAKMFSKQHPGYIGALGRLGRVHYMQQDYRRSLKYMNEALADHYRLIEDFFPAMSDGEKSRFWQTIRTDFEFFNTLAVVASKKKKILLGDLYDNALNTKSILLSSSIKVRNSVLNSGDNVLIATYERWEELKEKLIEELSLSPEQLKEEGLDPKKTQKEIDALEKQLGVMSSEFSKSQQASVVTWREIRKALQKDEVAVEILRFRHFDNAFSDSVVYVAMVLSPKHPQPLLIPLEDGNSLETKYLQYYRACIEYQIDDDLSYNHFWRAIDQVLEKGSRVYFSGEGAYSQINLEAVRADDGEYVIDHSNIVPVTSTRDLYTRRVLQANTASGGGKPVLIGNPTFYADLSDEELVDSRRHEVVQLKGTQEEVQAIEELLANQVGERPVTRINRMATEDFLREYSNPSILHIATHGYFLPDRKEKDEAFSAERASTSVLLRSGVLLAGAGDLMASGNIFEFNKAPGVLTAYEVASLRLDSTELVVLSACETARGDVQVGEGVFGLQRSFLIAGADAIIMSLFKVNDEATRKFMEYFYTNWKVRKMDKRDAFIQAKKELRKEFPEPIYWGPFIMVGS